MLFVSLGNSGADYLRILEYRKTHEYVQNKRPVDGYVTTALNFGALL
jgi:hypothetical protein